MIGTKIQVRSCLAVFWTSPLILSTLIFLLKESHYFPVSQGHWGNPFNTVEQIKMLNEYRSLSSF